LLPALIPHLAALLAHLLAPLNDARDGFLARW
jgi:hypothetical protein